MSAQAEKHPVVRTESQSHAGPVWLWLFPLATTVHNLEESIWLPAWLGRQPMSGIVWSPWTFRSLTVVLTMAAWWLTAWAWKRPAGHKAWYLTLGYAGIMGLNVIFPHALLTIKLRDLVPGTVSAGLLMLPTMTYVIFQALQQKYIAVQGLLRSMAAVGGGLIGTLWCVAYFSGGISF